jgi:RNA polymerase sigma-70 factor (ECF subfamily)
LSDKLLQRARSGDEAALRLFYEEHRPRVLRLAYSLLGDADEAEDVMQDVMAYALTHLGRYDPQRAAFATWLHTITVNRCRDRARRERLGWQYLARWLRGQRERVTPGPEADLDRLDAADRAGRALAGLTPRQREAIVLREVEGLTYEEIGQVLGVPMRTAQARVASAHAAMRRTLTQGQPAGEAGGAAGQ